MSFLNNIIKTAVISALGAKLGKGRSPIVTALIMLLATRALAGKQQPQASAPNDSAQSGGLSDLIDKFRQGGLDDIIKSWIGTGPNKPITPNQLHQTLGADRIGELTRETGLPEDELLAQLSRALPAAVDQLTPEGKVPDKEELLAGPRDD